MSIIKEDKIKMINKEVTVKVRCEIYCRVTGFYRPVSQFNPGKKEEFRLRKQYVFDESMLAQTSKGKQVS